MVKTGFDSGVVQTLRFSIRYSYTIYTHDFTYIVPDTGSRTQCYDPPKSNEVTQMKNLKMTQF